MLRNDGIFDWMEQRPGPSDKVYSERNSVELFIPHSMVGRLNGWYSRLFDLTKVLVDGVWRYTPNAAASVHGSVLLNGHAIQHYSVFASCWASGWRPQNVRGNAWEHESEYTAGAPDESKAFTAAQVATDLRIIADIRDFKARQGIDWKPTRPPANDRLNPNHTLYVHNECVRIWGGGATACESGRAAPLWAALAHPAELLEGGDDMPYATWVRDDKTGDSYVIVARKLIPINGVEQEKALLKAKYIRRPEIMMTTAELDTIPLGE